MKYFNSILAVLLSLTVSMVQAASKAEIDAKVKATIQQFYSKVPAGEELAEQSHAMLVFPEILKAGFVVGGEYGEGALIQNSTTRGYYNIASASFGFQAGVQQKTVVMLFMNDQALAKFKAAEGFEVGVDGAVAIAEFGAGTSLDSNTLQESIIAFVVSNKGLMAGVSLEGSKITEITK